MNSTELHDTNYPDHKIVFPLLDAFDVSQMLRISQSSVYELTRKGKLAYIRVTPGTKRFIEHQVRDFCRSQSFRRAEKNPTPEHIGISRFAFLKSDSPEDF
jgi:hypothetical protein